jgi:hypothetical protein
VDSELCCPKSDVLGEKVRIASVSGYYARSARLRLRPESRFYLTLNQAWRRIFVDGCLCWGGIGLRWAILPP